MTQLPWSDCKVAFGVEDEEAFEKWLAKISGGTGLPPEGIHPKGWELNETDASGARFVVVFRVAGLLTVDDGKTVDKLLKRIGKYRPTP